MADKPKGQCYIGLSHCTNHTLHDHHVHMRSLTGEAGAHVDLCGDCHTVLHAVAKALVTKMQGGKPNPKNLCWPYSRHPTEQQRATQLLQALVHVMLNTDRSGLPVAMSLSIPADVNRALEVLKTQMKLSKQQTVLLCISRVLESQGLLKK